MMTQSPYRTTFHRDGTMTIWDVYTQSWVRTPDPSDKLLAFMSQLTRERAIARRDRYRLANEIPSHEIPSHD